MANLLSNASPVLLEQVLNCMDLPLKEALSEAVNSLPLTSTTPGQRCSSLTS